VCLLAGQPSKDEQAARGDIQDEHTTVSATINFSEGSTIYLMVPLTNSSGATLGDGFGIISHAVVCRSLTANVFRLTTILNNSGGYDK
jgi:hypothetical protein